MLLEASHPSNVDVCNFQFQMLERDFMQLNSLSLTVELDDGEMGSFTPPSKSGPFLNFLAL